MAPAMVIGGRSERTILVAELPTGKASINREISSGFQIINGPGLEVGINHQVVLELGKRL